MTQTPQPALGIPKNEFLAQVRRSLGRADSVELGESAHSTTGPTTDGPLAESLAELEARAQAARQRLETERSALVEQFAETAQIRSWNLCRAASAEEAIGYIAELAQRQGVTQVARSDQPVFAELPLDTALENLGVKSVVVRRDADNSREQLRREMIASGIGITGADYAVAETGSVVVLPRPGLSRLVSLVPPVHVALVRPSDVVAGLDDVFLLQRLDYYRNGGDMGSYLNFITGPSRTGDIEMKLIVGVHGPREVHLVLLDS